MIDLLYPHDQLLLLDFGTTYACLSLKRINQKTYTEGGISPTNRPNGPNPRELWAIYSASLDHGEKIKTIQLFKYT